MENPARRRQHVEEAKAPARLRLPAVDRKRAQPPNGGGGAGSGLSSRQQCPATRQPGQAARGRRPRGRILAVFDNDPAPACVLCTCMAPCGVLYTPCCPRCPLWHCLCTFCTSEHPCSNCVSTSHGGCACPGHGTCVTETCKAYCCDKKLLERVRRTRCSWTTPCIGCTRVDEYPYEKLAQRRIAQRVLRAFRREGYEIIEYTLEEDLRSQNPIPDCDLAYFFIHDWPTIHEDPNWLSDFMRMFDGKDIPLTIPTKEQVYSMFVKTSYLNRLIPSMQPEGSILPTKICTSSSDMKEVVSWARSLGSEKVVTKENFSAGKEGVDELKVEPSDALLEKLIRLQANLDETSRQYPFFSPSFIVQQHEPRFLKEPEIRLFFSRGRFLYAVGHAGWLGPYTWPRRMEAKDERKIATQIFARMPELAEFALIRLDFGPTSRLNEIEMWPDMFGGPHLNLTGEEWSNVVREISGALIEHGKRLLSDGKRSQGELNNRPPSSGNNVARHHKAEAGTSSAVASTVVLEQPASAQ